MILVYYICKMIFLIRTRSLWLNKAYFHEGSEGVGMGKDIESPLGAGMGGAKSLGEAVGSTERFTEEWRGGGREWLRRAKAFVLGSGFSNPGAGSVSGDSVLSSVTPVSNMEVRTTGAESSDDNSSISRKPELTIDQRVLRDRILGHTRSINKDLDYAEKMLGKGYGEHGELDTLRARRSHLSLVEMELAAGGLDEAARSIYNHLLQNPENPRTEYMKFEESFDHLRKLNPELAIRLKFELNAKRKRGHLTLIK